MIPPPIINPIFTNPALFNRGVRYTGPVPPILAIPIAIICVGLGICTLAFSLSVLNTAIGEIRHFKQNTYRWGTGVALEDIFSELLFFFLFLSLSFMCFGLAFIMLNS